MGGKKHYNPKVKKSKICVNCSDFFETCKPNQRYCTKSKCQAARIQQNLTSYILREAKKLES